MTGCAGDDETIPLTPTYGRFDGHGAEEKEQIRTELLAGRYRFGLLARVTLKHGEEVDLWSARDALVLKALAIVLAKRHIRRRYSRVPLPQARLGRITPRPIRSTAAKH